MEVDTISNYLTITTPLPRYLPYARFLLSVDLSHTAKLVYTLLLDRAMLSQKNNWVDERGFVYVVFSITALSEVLQCSTMSVKRALRILESAELIERRRGRVGEPTKIFVKVSREQKGSLLQNTSAPYDGTKMTPAMEQKCSTNPRNKSKLMRAKNNCFALSGIPDYSFKEGESL